MFNAANVTFDCKKTFKAKDTRYAILKQGRLKKKTKKSEKRNNC